MSAPLNVDAKLRIQLWSSNYNPEPTGIGPLSRAWALAMRERGHDVAVVAAQPHYPEPRWGRGLRFRRERRDGIPVLRLPIWPGRETVARRLRQEATFVLALSATAPVLPRADVIVAVSPSFPALLPAMAAARLRRLPWVLWLQDILPDAAAQTGLLDESKRMVRVARRVERAAYRSAAKVVVISETFRENLRGKGVPEAGITRIYNPATVPVRSAPRDTAGIDDGLALNMGNIAHSQNLVEVTKAFEDSGELVALGAHFRMAGDGIAGDDVRAAIRTDRVRVTGLLDADELSSLIDRASVGVVTQRPRDHDFNVPSKLMNFMAAGVPVVASVEPDSEVARILNVSGGGWTTESGRLAEDFAPALARALSDPDERERRGAAALEFARSNFDPHVIAERFERVLREVTSR